MKIINLFSKKIVFSLILVFSLTACVYATNEVSGELGTAITTAQKLSLLTPASIWALVSLLSFVGLIKLYNDGKKDEGELKQLIKETSSILQKNSDALDRLHDRIDKCKYNG